MKPEICFVIPTHNRLTELRRNISQIIAACEGTVDQVRFAIFIMDNSSNDETFNFFSADVHPRVFYYRRESYVENGNESMHQIISEVNIDADWYWWLGDDDFILSNGILKIKKYIKDPTLGYIHATDFSSQIVHQDTVKSVRDLICEFGFMDLFSFMSSQLLSKRVFLKFRDTISTCLKVNWDYNFNHTMLLTKALWGEMGVVLAGGVITAQNIIFNKDQPAIENHMNGTFLDEVECASFYNSLRGWFNLSDCLESFTDQVPFFLPAAHSYFRFKGKPVWISFIMWMAKYGNASQLNIDESDYHRIRRLISMGEGDVSVYHSMLEFVYRLNELNKVADKTLRRDVIDNIYINFITYLHNFRTQ